MPKSDASEQDFIAYTFHGDPIPWDGETHLYLSLHTTFPGETGTQETNEATYVGYERMPLPRTSDGWTLTGGTAKNAVAVNFPTCTASPQTVTYLGIGTQETGEGKLLYYGALSSPLAITVGRNIKFPINAITIRED